MASSRTFTSTATALSEASRPPLAERIARNSTGVVLGSVLLLTGLAWLWTASGAGLGGDMAGMGSPRLILMLVMWWVMMAAMMLPSATPAILLYGRVRQERSGTAAIAASWMFLAGYLLAWLALSAAATGLQVAAMDWGLVDPMAMRATSPALAGGMLIAVGLYQWSPAKDACLTTCRSPAAFLSRYWRPGPRGALRLGLLHGLSCIGCCWLLMALLFVGGVMNFLWIAALTALVAAEKLLPPGRIVARVAGGVFIAWGAATIAGA